MRARALVGANAGIARARRHAMQARPAARHLTACAVVAFAAACATQAPPAPSAIARPATARLFAIRSSFWLNLHQRLFAETSDPHARQHAPAQAGAEAFTPAERATWDAALAFYRRWLADRAFFLELTDPLIAVNARLHEQADPDHLAAAGLDPALAAQLEAAAVVYRAHGWPADERADRAWITALAPRLDRRADDLARALVAVYATAWPARPIAVEVAPYVGSVGAYTTDDPPLITITSTTPSHDGDAALESIFHEASHVLVHGVQAAIAREATAQGRAEPDALWHALLFYTAGELTRRAAPRYVPYADLQGLYRRAPWDAYRRALATCWQPFLDGKIDRPAAIRALVTAVATPP
jgi:hypothetical protein